MHAGMYSAESLLSINSSKLDSCRSCMKTWESLLPCIYVQSDQFIVVFLAVQEDMNDLNISLGLELPHTHLGGHLITTVQDIFDLPFHMARDQIEQNLQAGMTSIKVYFQLSSHLLHSKHMNLFPFSLSLMQIAKLDAVT